MISGTNLKTSCVQEFPSYKATSSEMEKKPCKRSGLSQGRQFSSILPWLDKRVWPLVGGA